MLLREPADDIMPHNYGACNICLEFTDAACVMILATVVCKKMPLVPHASNHIKLLVGNERVSEHQRKIVMLEEENVTLKRKLKKVERNQEKTWTKVARIESRLLEGNIIMNGLDEEEKRRSIACNYMKRL